MKSARINFGIPDSEYILEVDDSGAATSLVNQDTNTEYVGGGGGSSDFTTAEVTVTLGTPGNGIVIPFVDLENNRSDVDIIASGTYQVILYKGVARGYSINEVISVTGAIEEDDTELIVTGNGTIETA